ncbi:MAG: AraC family transcriptional regulator [SAR86 cluster bacterium]|uniref:AraC family transcriptional regulator n=1 Tax=SAR86 cluster bacterium TaxID=2030880 RepID=A0A2A4MVS6_9GAMM|nr:MAG: AraC family transcriptional regulator [SAR86 cluster bacterium]
MLKEGHYRLNNLSGLNVLDDVIDTLRFRGSIFFHSELAAPWGMSLPQISSPRFHISLQGGFYIGTGDHRVDVKQRDIVMLPKGNMHWIADAPNTKLIPSELAGNACELGQPLFQNGKITNRVMCGIIEYDNVISHPIIGALPNILQLSNIQEEDSIWVIVKQIDTEILRSNSKKNIIIDRLTEILFIQLLRRYISDNEHLTGFLAALQDSRIAKILHLIHKNPEKPWTLDIMSGEANMSRATLQRKFKASLGLSPISYLSRWRIAKAYQLVKYSSLSLNHIADNIGFADARTMRIAFQRYYGITPSKVRKSLMKTV